MKKVMTIIAAVTGILVILGGGYFVSECPCDQLPGVALWGDEVTEPVEDWSFANDVTLCQLQVTNGVFPQSLNLNCMSGDGVLTISCSRCEGKRWSSIAMKNPVGKIRIGDLVYPVRLTRLTDPGALDTSWYVRREKLAGLGRDVSRERPEHWWSFQLESL